MKAFLKTLLAFLTGSMLGVIIFRSYAVWPVPVSILGLAVSIAGMALAKFKAIKSLLAAGTLTLAVSILGLALATSKGDRSPASASARQVPSEHTMVTEWIGIAASPNGRVFRIANQSYAALARNAAKYKCEQEIGRTCTAIAVPMSWDVVVLTCLRRGQSPIPIVAGSDQNAAMEVALDKAEAAGVDPRNCSQVYAYLPARTPVPTATDL
jgi:hypothetical protein